jgi:hypothetical protein
VRFGRTIEDRRGVDDPGYEPPVEDLDEPSIAEEGQPLFAISQAATAATAIGGALIVIASFLPLDEPSGLFSRVASNTIVQQEEFLIPVFGGLIVVAAVSSYLSRQRRASTVILSILTTVLVVVMATNKSNRTLYPLNSLGEAENSGNGTVVPFGIAIYVVGAGAALAVLGSLAMYKAERIDGVTEPSAVRADNRATKQCPDCAETILAQARVCKHCGYRFA